jgi:imidazolonepropionase-like amidohydrolase
MYAVRAAACFDGTSFRDGATVLVEGEEIVAVEPLAHDVPDGVEVTTYDGTLLPGLFDCHVHLVSDGEVGSLERAGTRTDLELDEVIAASLAAQARGGVTWAMRATAPWWPATDAPSASPGSSRPARH